MKSGWCCDWMDFFGAKMSRFGRRFHSKFQQHVNIRSIQCLQTVFEWWMVSICHLCFGFHFDLGHSLPSFHSLLCCPTCWRLFVHMSRTLCLKLLVFRTSTSTWNEVNIICYSIVRNVSRLFARGPRNQKEMVHWQDMWLKHAKQIPPWYVDSQSTPSSSVGSRDMHKIGCSWVSKGSRNDAVVLAPSSSNTWVTFLGYKDEMCVASTLL